MTLVTIVPRLRPAIDGVGDYAMKLASQLHQDFELSTQFIAGDPDWRSKEELAGLAAIAVDERSVASLTAGLQGQSVVLLHYVPHGYAAKACPFWLIKGLERWHASTPNSRLVTMFHELYALDWHRPWSSDFYLSLVQQHLAGRIAQLSDACLTSTARYTRTITRLSRGKHTQVPVMPVFSNVGEPSHVLPLEQRQRRLIIFGQRHSKRLIYQQSLAVITQLCQQLNLQEIWDIGPTTDITPATVNTIPVKELGQLSETQISLILSESLAGFLNYDPKRLGKSGIFAAFCAHGLLPINHRALGDSLDGLTAGSHYGSLEQGPIDISLGQEIATQALNWYRQHALPQQAHIIYRQLPQTLVKNCCGSNRP